MAQDGYHPLPFPGGDVEALAKWIELELERLSISLVEQVAVDLRPVYREPERPRDGMLVFADGTEWNPGSGAGTYERRGGAWVKL